MARSESNEILEAALVGYRHELSRIEEKMAEIRSRLGEHSAEPAAKRGMSTAGRQRLAAAQKKRWQAFRSQKQAPAAKAGKSRISAAGRRRIIEATKKRWAEYRAKKAAGGKG